LKMIIAADSNITHGPVRTLVVDDSPLMRNAIQSMLGKSDSIEVVGTASNGLECLQKIRDHRPDVITLDIDMPLMNGISAIKNIMVRHQIPILIISSLVQDGYFSFEALRLGVMDFFPKPAQTKQMNALIEEEFLRNRVLTAAGMQVHSMRRVRLKRKARSLKLNPRTRPKSAVVMGTTLAGPNTIMHIVSDLPEDYGGVIIAVQEIHPRILVPFCSYFNEISPLEVVPVTSSQPLLPGKIYIGSTFGGVAVEEAGNGSDALKIFPADSPHMPIDKLFKSTVRQFRQNTCGVLLTGIGVDGVDGMAEIKAHGGLTIAQEKSCCPYPNLIENVIERGTVDLILSTRGIVDRIKSWTRA